MEISKTEMQKEKKELKNKNKNKTRLEYSRAVEKNLKSNVSIIILPGDERWKDLKIYLK